MEDPATEAELTALARRVEERLAARRAAGELPDALEAELDRYLRLYGGLDAVELPQDRARAELREALDRPAFGSPRRGRSPRHVAARVAGAPVLAGEVQRWRAGMEGALVACLEAIDRFEVDGLPAARDALTMVLDRLAALTVLEDAVADLEARMRAVEDRLGPTG